MTLVPRQRHQWPPEAPLERCPVYPRKQTFVSDSEMSAKGH
jgi:hypothetical protein